MFPQIHGIRITLGSIVPDISLFLGEVVRKDRVFVKQLLAKMDGVEGLGVPTLLVGLTNKPSLIDQALMRPGR